MVGLQIKNKKLFQTCTKVINLHDLFFAINHQIHLFQKQKKRFLIMVSRKELRNQKSYSLYHARLKNQVFTQKSRQLSKLKLFDNIFEKSTWNDWITFIAEKPHEIIMIMPWRRSIRKKFIHICDLGDPLRNTMEFSYVRRTKVFQVSFGIELTIWNYYIGIALWTFEQFKNSYYKKK